MLQRPKKGSEIGGRKGYISSRGQNTTHSLAQRIQMLSQEWLPFSERCHVLDLYLILVLTAATRLASGVISPVLWITILRLSEIE